MPIKAQRLSAPGVGMVSAARARRSRRGPILHDRGSLLHPLRLHFLTRSQHARHSTTAHCLSTPRFPLLSGSPSSPGGSSASSSLYRFLPLPLGVLFRLIKGVLNDDDTLSAEIWYLEAVVTFPCQTKSCLIDCQCGGEIWSTLDRIPQGSTNILCSFFNIFFQYMLTI